MKSTLSPIPPDTTIVSYRVDVATLTPWWTLPSAVQPKDVLSPSTAMYVPAARFGTVSTPPFGLPPAIESMAAIESLKSANLHFLSDSSPAVPKTPSASEYLRIVIVCVMNNGVSTAAAVHREKLFTLGAVILWRRLLIVPFCPVQVLPGFAVLGS